MKILKKILLGSGILILAVIVVSQFLPSSYSLERSIVIASKSEAIFPYVNNLKKWPEWSPWGAMDSSIVYTYEGSEQGIGAISKWNSKKMGDGSMQIIQSDPGKGVKFDLSFNHGKDLAQGRINFEPATEGTRVIWSMTGNVSRNPVNRIFGLLMDKMIGSAFDQGLADLKKKSEGK